MKHQKYYKLEQKLEKKRRKPFAKKMYLFGFLISLSFFLYFMYLVVSNG